MSDLRLDSEHSLCGSSNFHTESLAWQWDSCLPRAIWGTGQRVVRTGKDSLIWSMGGGEGGAGPQPVHCPGQLAWECVCVCVCVCDRKKEREVTFPGPPSSTLFWSQKRVTSLRCMLLAQPHLHHLI
jgi:hypothetical protein